MSARSLTVIVGLVVSVLILASCGQKGPLYLPQDPMAASTPAATAPVTTAPATTAPAATAPASTSPAQTEAPMEAVPPPPGEQSTGDDSEAARQSLDDIPDSDQPNTQRKPA